MNINLWKNRGRTEGGLERLRDEMDRTFEKFLNEPFGFGALATKDRGEDRWLPPVDVSESDAEVTVRAEVPGVPVKDISISLAGTVLTISGQKEESTEKKEENFFRCERRFGSFRRVVELPETIDPDKVTAESDNGVVTVHVGKKPGAKPRIVEVKPTAKKVAVT